MDPFRMPALIALVRVFTTDLKYRCYDRGGKWKAAAQHDGGTHVSSGSRFSS